METLLARHGLAMTNSLFNNLIGNSSQPAPEVGMGGTLLFWTDRHAVTVVAVSASGKTVTVQRDRATRTDTNGMGDSQSYAFERDTAAPLQKFSLRKNDKWMRVGSSMHDGTQLALGSRSEYYDFSF